MLKFLIDTGAEVNLVKKGRIPTRYFSFSKKRIILVTASGQNMNGGQKEVTLSIHFDMYTRDFSKRGSFSREGTLYEADIDIDGILSHHWLHENGLGVYPHLDSLALDSSELTLIRGLDTHSWVPTPTDVNEFRIDYSEVGEPKR